MLWCFYYFTNNYEFCFCFMITKIFNWSLIRIKSLWSIWFGPTSIFVEVAYQKLYNLGAHAVAGTSAESKAETKGKSKRSRESSDDEELEKKVKVKKGKVL